MTDGISEDNREAARARSAAKQPGTPPKDSDDCRRMYDFGSEFENILDDLGIELQSHSKRGDGKDKWEFTLLQVHGPFETRGEALSWALTNLVQVAKP